jgi:hypothetical protein
MRTKLLVLAAAGMMAMGTGSVMLIGCGSGTSTYHPPASQLKEGVNLLDVKDPAWGANAAFVQGGRVIYMETRVGPPKPDVYRQSWPDDPPNEMDMRFVDQNGYTFYVMRGGDSLIDPTWSEEIGKTQAANRMVSNADRNLDWQMAQAGAKALAGALPTGFQDHAFHLTSFSRLLPPAEDPMMQAKLERIKAAPLPAGDRPYGNFSYAANQSWLETDAYSGDTGCAVWICVAKHSATRMWDAEWNGSAYTWVLAVDANNHGRHATDSGMGYHCYSNGGWYGAGTTISGSTAGSATGSWDGQGGCQTAYSWSSNNNAHLCNDDAAYELWQAKSGTVNTPYGTNTSFWWGKGQGASGYGAVAGFNQFSCDYPSGD